VLKGSRIAEMMTAAKSLSFITTFLNLITQKYSINK
jgi:hypothetical protein